MKRPVSNGEKSTSSTFIVSFAWNKNNWCMWVWLFRSEAKYNVGYCQGFRIEFLYSYVCVSFFFFVKYLKIGGSNPHHQRVNLEGIAPFFISQKLEYSEEHLHNLLTLLGGEKGWALNKQGSKYLTASLHSANTLQISYKWYANTLKCITNTLKTRDIFWWKELQLQLLKGLCDTGSPSCAPPDPTDPIVHGCWKYLTNISQIFCKCCTNTLQFHKKYI